MNPREYFKSTHGKVKLSDLVTDGRFNREINPNWVAHIVANFNGRAFGRLVISKRPNGKFVIIDGQHRAEALRQLGIPEDRQIIPVEIHEDLSDRDEAYLTKQYNDAKLFGPLPKFKAMLHAGDPDCRAINTIIKERGLRLGNGRARDGVISSVTTLERLYQMSKPKGVVLKETLDVILGAWGTSSDSLNRIIIEGIGLYLYEHPTSDRDVLAKKLATFRAGPAGLRGHAGNLRGPAATMPLAVAVSQVIERNVMKSRRRLKSA